MNSVLSSVSSLLGMFNGKTQEFINEIDNVHMVWLEELQQEAHRMFSRDFNTEPELMPKTPSQKKNSRRKRVSLGRQEENQSKRRFSKGRRSNLRGSAVKSLNLIDEDEITSEASISEASSTAQSKRPTRKKKQAKSQAAEDVSQSPDVSRSEEEQNKKPELEIKEDVKDSEEKPADTHGLSESPAEVPMRDVSVCISPVDRLSAELAKKPEPSPGRSAAKIAIADASRRSRRSSARCSLKVRQSVAGLRHRMTLESVRRASRRSMLKKKAARTGNSMCSSNVEDSSNESAEEEDEDVLVEAIPVDTVDNVVPETRIKPPESNNTQSVQPTHERVTRLVAANSPSLAPPPLFVTKPKKTSDEEMTSDTEEQPVRRSSRSTKRKAPDTVEGSPAKRLTPPKKTQAIIKPNMRSFLHTVQKNQMLMMTPSSLSRTAVMKSFIKHTTPLKVDPKLNAGLVAKERQKLELLKKKQEQEEERMKKMEEEKRKKQEELKRKRDERLRRVFEAKVKEEQKEEEKKKRIEQKMAQVFDKNDKRLAEEKAKKKVALKRQEELELKKKLEEEAKKKIQQAEEEKRQQEILAQKKAEEEELQARKLAEARKALELEREKEQQAAAAERARVEKEKLLALQREVERAAREKEMRDLENQRKAQEAKRKLEEQQRLAANEKALKEREAAKQKEAAAKQISAVLNSTVDIERSALNSPAGKGPLLNVTVDVVEPTSPQSYVLSPKGGNKPLTSTVENYGMDQNSDDSTDDESAPRKRVPSWAQGPSLQRTIMKQYFNPPDLDSFCGVIEPIKLEEIFNKKKPRYFKRTSSAVWHSPLAGAK